VEGKEKLIYVAMLSAITLFHVNLISHEFLLIYAGRDSQTVIRTEFPNRLRKHLKKINSKRFLTMVYNIVL
jgi:hypothetical protein